VALQEGSSARLPLRLPLATALVALPWLNPFLGGPSPSVQPWLLSAACGLLLWLLAAFGPAPARLRLPWPLLALVAWAVLSQASLRPDVVYLAAGLLLIAIASSAGGDETMGDALQTGLLLAAVVSAALGLAQYFGIAAWLSPWVSHAEAGEAYANLRQPNQYATLTWIGAAVLLWGTVRVRLVFAMPMIALLAVGSAASVSRTGMLQGLILTLLAAWWNGPERRRRLTLCAVAALAYFAAAAVLPALLEALTGALPARTLWGRLGGGEGCSSRLVLWSNVLHLIALEPLTGWGWGNLDYAHFMTLYPGGRFCDILDNAHDLPLHLAVELGVPAAVLLCAGMLVWTWRRQPWREASPERQLAWALLAIVALHSLLEYPLWYGPFQLGCGLAIGWLAPAAAPRPAAHRASLALAALLLATVGYAAWDYERVSQIYLPPEQRRAGWRDDTLRHTRRSWLFAGQARFAELTLASVKRENAPAMHALALEMLHYSPEPRVAERVIESATLLGRENEAVLFLARFRAAFPREYQAWRDTQQLPGAASGPR
jgi:O-antigen ligase